MGPAHMQIAAGEGLLAIYCSEEVQMINTGNCEGIPYRAGCC